MTRSRCSFISVVSAASAAAARWMDGCSVVQDLSTREWRQQPNNQLDIQLQQRRTGAIWGISCRVWFSSLHPPPGSRGGGRQGCANGETKQQQQQQQQQQQRQYKTWRRGTEGRRGHGHGAEDGSCRDIGVVNSNSAPGDFIAKRSVEFAATEGNSKQF